MRFNDKIIDEAKQGQEVSFKVGEEVRKNDILYKIERRNIKKEELEYEKIINKIGIHKPFKTTKKRGKT